jgi:hypothetical protein
MKKLLIVVAILLAGYNYFYSEHGAAPNGAFVSALGQSTNNTDAIISNAFANHESNLQVSGQGIVFKLLPDDNSGSRHQRFLVELSSGQTVLIAHNLDIAPRVDGLSEGDSIKFYGVYEWNPKGGVIHWTHGDPDGSHVSGWLQHHGQTYQ